MSTRKKKTGHFKELLASSGQAKPPVVAAQQPANARRMKAGYTQVGANIPKELKRRVFKRLPDEEGLTFSGLVERLLESWLKGKE
jgi:hypothetical protein